MSGRDDRAFSDLQRALILRAMVELIAERGYANVSLAMVLERAGVSRHVFRTHFAGVEDCFTAILDAGMERMAAVMLDAFDGQEDWLDGLLAAEAAVLSSLDADPEMARVLLVDSLAAGSWALERRVRNVQALRAQIVERWRDAPPARAFPPLAADGVMASIIGLLHDHLVRRVDAPLISLLGPMMGVITAPYLDADAVAREVSRGEELSRGILARSPPVPARSPLTGFSSRLPAVLGDPRAHRARGCVLFLAGRPGASGRQVADAIGLRGHSQVSMLLARLTGAGVVVKETGRPGGANGWRLSPLGVHAAELLRRAGTGESFRDGHA
ncbi:MAG: TetR/AcrR family transcriptional regulator [Solirubrobacteraceae bacterium]|jgi:AcrR family transcriptional regulator